MAGFVGSQARRRRRNRFLLILSIIVIIGIFFYLPSIDFSTDDTKPPIEIIPSTIIDESSLRSEIEELKLEVFQKDQRLKFRDDQIKNLRNEIRDLNDSFVTIKADYEKSLNNISDLENNTLENNSQNIEKLSTLENQIIELKKQLSKYEQLVKKLETELASATSSEDVQEVNIENSILKSELKQIQQKNNNFEAELEELRKLIKNKDKELEDLIYLKDLQHHS